MKELITLLLAVVLCLSITACGASDTTDNEDNAGLQETAPMAALPPNSVDTAPNNSDDADNNSTETNTENYETIELTAENWDQYFEFIVRPSFTTNAFGELARFELWPYFSLKEEYVSRIVTDQTTIAIEMTYLYGERVCSVDINTMSYTLGDYTPKGQRGEDIIDQTQFIWGDTFYGCNVGGLCYLSGNELNYYYSDFEIVRIMGNLVLKSA